LSCYNTGSMTVDQSG